MKTGWRGIKKGGPEATLTLDLAVAAAAPAKGAFLLRPGFVNGQGPPVHLAAVEPGNGLLSFQFGFHLYKSKAPGLARLPIGNDLG
jgi:hypothetical protein